MDFDLWSKIISWGVGLTVAATLAFLQFQNGRSRAKDDSRSDFKMLIDLKDEVIEELKAQNNALVEKNESMRVALEKQEIRIEELAAKIRTLESDDRILMRRLITDISATEICTNAPHCKTRAIPMIQDEMM